MPISISSRVHCEYDGFCTSLLRPSDEFFCLGIICSRQVQLMVSYHRNSACALVSKKSPVGTRPVLPPLLPQSPRWCESQTVQAAGACQLRLWTQSGMEDCRTMYRMFSLAAALTKLISALG